MKSLILVLCVLVSLSACQSDNSVGSGPLTLAPDVQAHFDEYMERDSPTVFVVSTDGNVASYLYCPSAADACIPGTNIFHALESCQKGSGGVPCKIYAKGHNIVWEGAIHGTASEPAKNVSEEQRLQIARTFSGRNDEEICGRALSSDRETPGWDTRTRWREYVDEAKRRDFTPRSCAKFLGWKVELFEKDTPRRQIDSGSYALRRPIAVQWDGFDGPIAGYVQITGDGKLEKIKLALPGSLGECTGKAEYKKRNSGLWFIKCSNGKSASGAFFAHGSGKGSSGDGYDNNGRKVKFTISGV